jgi:hypothetical protein
MKTKNYLTQLVMFPVTLVSVKEKSISTYCVKAEKEKVQAKKVKTTSGA